MRKIKSIHFIYLFNIVLVFFCYCEGTGELLCENNKSLCGSECIDLNVDPDNCGSCGHVCINTLCSSGECQSVCNGDLIECNGGCVDSRYDPDNCGSCGHKCEDGFNCNNGECKSECSQNTWYCDGYCVDLKKDPQNCGDCGYECGDNQTCTDGECIDNCSNNMSMCNDTCVDLESDKENCGSCEKVCSQDGFCINGDCVDCDEPLMMCDDNCVNPLDDEDNCGDCGNVCDESEICKEGDCILNCPQNYSICNQECVDTMVDPDNCGECNHICRPDQLCDGGNCRCTGEKQDCLDECVDTQLDPQNCGDCGNVCLSVEVCIDGDCSQNCSGNLTLCGDSCVDTDYDPNNCGDCSHACGNEQYCSDGNCVYGQCDGDLCNEAIDVSQGGRFTDSIDCASDNYQSETYGGSGKDLVFVFTVSEESDVFISTIGSDFDSVIYISNECGLDNMGGNDDFANSTQSLKTLTVSAGTYYIILDTYYGWATGNYVLDVYISPSNQIGDKCGNPMYIDSVSNNSITGDTCSQTATYNEDDSVPKSSCSSSNGGRDEVFYFVLNETTEVTFSTCDTTAWDSILYLRSICSDVESQINCSDDSCYLQSSFTQTLEPGLYFLWLDGYSASACGSFTLTM